MASGFCRQCTDLETVLIVKNQGNKNQTYPGNLLIPYI